MPRAKPKAPARKKPAAKKATPKAPARQAPASAIVPAQAYASPEAVGPQLPDDPHGLTLQRRRFVEEYLVDFNGAAAARRAGYSPASARSQASELLTIPNVRQAVAEGMTAARDRNELSRDRLLMELRSVAFSNVLDVVRVRGDSLELRSDEEITPEQRAAVSKIKAEVRETIKDEGETIQRYTTYEVQMHPKLTAIAKLLELPELAPIDADGTIRPPTAALAAAAAKAGASASAQAGVAIVVMGGPMGLEVAALPPASDEPSHHPITPGVNPAAPPPSGPRPWSPRAGGLAAIAERARAALATTVAAP